MRPGQLHVAIIGAGATGTELSAELHRTARAVVAYGLDRIDPDKDIEITLIEAAPRILPALPERLSDATTALLRELGVEVRTDARVTEVTADGVQLADGDFIPSELVVWAAGVKGPDVLADLDGLEVSRSNQLVVEPTLQTTRDPDIFAIGDCAFLPARPARTARCRRAPRPRTSRRATCCARSAAASAAAAAALRLPRLRLAGLARPLLHRRQPDGLHRRQEHVHRGLVRPPDVPLALQDAPEGPARPDEGRSSTPWPAPSPAGPSRM